MAEHGGHIPYVGYDGNEIRPFSLVKDRDNNSFVFLDEIKDMPGHCLVCSMQGELQPVTSTDDFSSRNHVQKGSKRAFARREYWFCNNPTNSPGSNDIPCYILAQGNGQVFVSLGPGAPPQSVPLSFVHSIPTNTSWRNSKGQTLAEEIEERQRGFDEAQENKPDWQCLDGTETHFWSAEFMGRKFEAWQVNREGNHLVIVELLEPSDSPERKEGKPIDLGV